MTEADTEFAFDEDLPSGVDIMTFLMPGGTLARIDTELRECPEIRSREHFVLNAVVWAIASLEESRLLAMGLEDGS